MTRFDYLLLCDLAMSCCALVLDYCYAEILKYLQSVSVAFIYQIQTRLPSVGT